MNDFHRSARHSASVLMCIGILLVLATASGYSQADAQPSPGKAKAVAKNIAWLGQSSVRIETNGKIIYIDPIRVREGDKADLILITHLHDDHYQSAKIQQLLKDGTIVISPRKISLDSFILKPGESTNQLGIQIEAVPAYNVAKTSFHPKKDGNNGYILTVEDVRIYHAGDTERIPEMQQITCDIALVPLGQTYTFVSVDEAVDAVIDTKALIAIPIHYGMYEGTEKDAQEFRGKLKKKGVAVTILKAE